MTADLPGNDRGAVQVRVRKDDVQPMFHQGEPATGTETRAPLDQLTPLIPVVAHTLIIYFFITIFFSTIGRRFISQITTLELVAVALLGSSVETAMVAGNLSLLAGLASAGTLLVANRALSVAIGRSLGLRRILIGEPLLLVYHGRFVYPNLRRAGSLPGKSWGQFGNAATATSPTSGRRLSKSTAAWE